MATKRLRNGSWAYTIRRANMLPRPLHYTFDDEAEGDAFCAKLEAMLDKGILPPDLAVKAAEGVVSELLTDYKAAVNLAASDVPVVNSLITKLGKTKLASLDYDWVERYVEKMKDEGYAPGSIRKRVESLARAVDWALRKSYSDKLLANPFRLLPKGYSSGHREDEERDRRLEPGEEKAILAQLDGEYRLLAQLALETAMRLSEMYSLTADQIDLPRATIFLHKTKNGTKRQVPLSSVAIGLLTGFPGFSFGPKSALTTARLSAHFRRAFDKAGCADLRFHDLRHEATCRLYERTTLTDLQIAKITGHKTLKMLARYANLRASDLANRLW